MDRILMNMAAFRASQGPVFEPRWSGNDALDHEAGVAVWQWDRSVAEGNGFGSSASGGGMDQDNSG